MSYALYFAIPSDSARYVQQGTITNPLALLIVQDLGLQACA